MARKDPLAHLSRHATLADALAREVRALGAAALPGLRAYVLDPAAYVDADTPAFRGARNATWLLAGWPDPAASAILIDALVAAPPASVLAGALGLALSQRGPEVVEPLLALRGTPAGDEALEALVLRGPGRGAAPDPRVTAWIAEVIPRDPARGASLAEDWPEPALVPALEAAFDALFAPVDALESQAPTLLKLVEAADACGSTDVGRPLQLRARLVRRVDDLADESAELEARVEALAAARDLLLARSRR